MYYSRLLHSCVAVMCCTHVLQSIVAVMYMSCSRGAGTHMHNLTLHSLTLTHVHHLHLHHLHSHHLHVHQLHSSSLNAGDVFLLDASVPTPPSPLFPFLPGQSCVSCVYRLPCLLTLPSPHTPLTSPQRTLSVCV